MGNGYIDNWGSSDGDTISAGLFETEYNNISDAFDKTAGHNHDGVTAANGGLIPLIDNNGTSVVADATAGLENIKFAIVGTDALELTDTILRPIVTDTIDLGQDLLRYNNAYLTLTDTTTLTVGDSTVPGRIIVTDVLDEDDLVTDSDTALATQQSIKTYVDTAITALPSEVGIYNQNTYTQNSTPQSLLTSFPTNSGYLEATLLQVLDTSTIQVTADLLGDGSSTDAITEGYIEIRVGKKEILGTTFTHVYTTRFNFTRNDIDLESNNLSITIQDPSPHANVGIPTDMVYTIQARTVNLDTGNIIQGTMLMQELIL